MFFKIMKGIFLQVRLPPAIKTISQSKFLTFFRRYYFPSFKCISSEIIGKIKKKEWRDLIER